MIFRARLIIGTAARLLATPLLATPLLSTPLLSTPLLSTPLLSTPLFAATLHLQANMLAASEVPSTDTAGAGTMEATYDTVTHQLDYTLVWNGLTGPATMAHFHGPAAAGVNAGVAVPLGMAPVSPLKGSATLTDAQAAQLESGQWYVNVHTGAHPKGEIRGQVIAAK